MSPPFVGAVPKSPPMCSQSSSDAACFCFASLITSCAVFPEGSAIGIISCSIGNDSWFWNSSITTPDGRVAGTLWNWKFWAKIVAFGVSAPPDEELDDEQPTVVSAITAATMASLTPAPTETERVIRHPFPRRSASRVAMEPRWPPEVVCRKPHDRTVMNRPDVPQDGGSDHVSLVMKIARSETARSHP